MLQQILLGSGENPHLFALVYELSPLAEALILTGFHLDKGQYAVPDPDQVDLSHPAAISG